LKLRRTEIRLNQNIPKLNCLHKQKFGERPILKNSRFLYTNDISGISGISMDSPVIPIRQKLKYVVSSSDSEEKNLFKSKADKTKKKAISKSKLISKLVSSSSSAEKNDVKYSIGNGNERRLIKLISKLNKNLETTEDNINLEEYNNIIKAQWKLLSKIFDRMLLITFSIITFFVLGSILIQAPNFMAMFLNNKS
jgi:hypothetical protein